jgi:hypothetical protein
MPNLSYSQLMGIKKVAKASKTANIIDIGGVIASTITETIFSVSNAKQKAEMMANLNEFKESELQELEGLLKRQQSRTDRIATYLDYVSRVVGAKEEQKIKGTIGKIATKESSDEKRLMKLIFGGAIALILVAVVIKKIRK